MNTKDHIFPTTSTFIAYPVFLGGCIVLAKFKTHDRRGKFLTGIAEPEANTAKINLHLLG